MGIWGQNKVGSVALETGRPLFLQATWSRACAASPRPQSQQPGLPDARVVLRDEMVSAVPCSSTSPGPQQVLIAAKASAETETRLNSRVRNRSHALNSRIFGAVLAVGSKTLTEDT